jgi:hypothetical protein
MYQLQLDSVLLLLCLLCMLNFLLVIVLAD